MRGLELHSQDELGAVFDLRLTVRLLRYTKPYMGAIALAVVLLIATSVLTLLPPELVKGAIDDHITPAINLAPGAVDWHMAEVLRTALWLLGILVASAFIVFLQQILMAHTGQSIMCDLRRDVFGNLQDLPLAYYDANPTGKLVTRVTNDINVMNEAFASVIIYMVRDLCVMIGILVRLGMMNSRLTPWMLVSVPFVAIGAFLFRPISRKYWRRVREALARLNSYLHESLSGVHIIKMFNRESRRSDEFAEINEANCSARIGIIRVDSLFNSVIMVVTTIPVALLLWRGGLHMLNKDLTQGEFYVYLIYLGLFYRPITAVAEKFLLLQSAMAAGERVFQVIDEPGTVADPAEPKSFDPTDPSIEFEDVRFSYDGSTEVLHGVSFGVARGETVALVGSTGSGKTTTTSLVPRFYDVTGGRVLVGGRDVREFKVSELRGHIAIVMQDTFVFSSTIRENIKLFSDHIADEDVERAIEMVGADDFVRDLPQGLDTRLPERGSSLSEGQRQLLAFARALAHDREILILDEATARIDTKTEMLIQKATETLLEGRTSIVVAHRLSTIKKADRILVFADGEIVEEGTHDELMKERGRYWRMCQV